MSNLVIEKQYLECKKCPMFERVPDNNHHPSWLEGKNRMGWCHRYDIDAGNWYCGRCYNKVRDVDNDKPIVKLRK